MTDNNNMVTDLDTGAADSSKKISVVIHTYNAEKHLAKVIDAVRDFDEIIVCDMESTDSTQDIARKHGCKVIIFPKGEHKIAEPARNFAIHSAANKWVLVVDADEIISAELRAYLYERIKDPACPSGIYIARKNFFMHRTFGYPDYQLRFMERDKTEWPPYVHSMPNIEGRVEYIPKSRKELAMIHLADDTIRIRLNKTNDYTDNEVKKKSGRKYGFFKLVFTPLWWFFRSYIIKGGCLKGSTGLINSGFDAFYKFVMIAKIIEHDREINNG